MRFKLVQLHILYVLSSDTRPISSNRSIRFRNTTHAPCRGDRKRAVERFQIVRAKSNTESLCAGHRYARGQTLSLGILNYSIKFIIHACNVCVCVFFFFYIFPRTTLCYTQHGATRAQVHRLSTNFHLLPFLFLFFFFRFFPFSSSSCKFHSHSHAFSVFSLILFCLYRFAFVNVDRNPSHEIRRKDSMDRATRDQKKISLQVYLDREVRNDGGGKIERDTFSQ